MNHSALRAVRCRVLVVCALYAMSGCAARRGPQTIANEKEIEVTLRTSYYQVDLLDPRTLSRAMWDMGMAPRSGVVGTTSSRFQWLFNAVPSGNGMCSIRDVRVTGEVGITLPRWTPPVGTSPERRSWWTAYSSAVRTHENTHVEILRDYFRKTLRQAEGMTGRGCEQLQVSAREIFRKATAAMEQKQQDFDRTDRGILIGNPPPAL
jgi:predicted secreted Zn-dependent protease